MTDRVTMTDIRNAGFCASGLKEFCDKYDINLRTLVKEGVPVSEVEHIEDANLQHVLEVKREQEL